MKIITLSREFGSGGRELGKRLADALGFAYYDKEIIAAVAEKSGTDKAYAENILNKGFLTSFPFTFRRSFGIYAASNSLSTELLVMQKNIIEDIAKKGGDFVIVGRNADVILNAYKPFNIFVCADKESKIKRCRKYAENKELSDKEIEKNLRDIDAGRARIKEILSGQSWGAKENYHLTLNTSGWSLKDLTLPTKEFANAYFGRNI